MEGPVSLLMNGSANFPFLGVVSEKMLQADFINSMSISSSQMLVCTGKLEIRIFYYSLHLLQIIIPSS